MTPNTLQPGLYYHIFNRGNNKEYIFIEEGNYYYFLELYAKYVCPVMDTFAYCLLRNHFHFLIRIKENLNTLTPSRAFANLFGTYAKAINKKYNRSGSLFEKPFHRKLIQDERYLTHLVIYIHHNPQIHCLVDDFRQWPFSSYQAILSTKSTRVNRESILDWFGNRENFEEFHLIEPDYKEINGLIQIDA